MSRMLTIVPSAAAKAIESGMRVSFIQNPRLESSPKRKIIPASSGREVRFIRPTSRFFGVSATSTGTTTSSPEAVSIVTAGPVCSGSVVVVSGSLEVPAGPDTVVVGGLDSSPPQAETPSRAPRHIRVASKRTTVILPAQHKRAPSDPLVLVRPLLGRGRAADAA